MAHQAPVAGIGIQFRTIGLILVGPLLGAILALVYALAVVPRTYQSRGTVVFPISDAGRPNPLDTMGIGSLMAAPDVPFASALPILTYSAIINSQDVLTLAAEELGLAAQYDLPNKQAIVAFMRGTVATEVSPERLLKVTVSLPGTPRLQSWRDLAEPARSAKRDEAVRRLVAPVVGSLIGHMGSSAQKLNLDAAASELRVLRDQQSELSGQLEGLRKNRVALQETLSAPDGGVLTQAISTALTAAQAEQRTVAGQLSGLQRQRNEIQSQLALLRKHLRDLPDGLPMLSAQSRAYAAARDQLEAAEQRFGPESPAVLAAREEASLSWQRLQSAASAASAGLTTEMMSLDARMAEAQGRQAALAQQVKDLQNQAAAAPGQADQLTSLTASVAHVEEQLSAVSTQLRLAEARYAARGMSWQVMDEPLEPLRKSAPSGLRYALLGFIIGGLVGNAGRGWRAIRQLAIDLHDEQSAPTP